MNTVSSKREIMNIRSSSINSGRIVYVDELPLFVSIVAFVMELFGKYFSNTGIQSVASYIFALSIPTGLFSTIVYKGDLWQRRNMLVVLLMFISTLFAYLFSGSTLGNDAFVKLYCYLYVPFAFSAYSYIKRKKLFRRRILLLAKMLVVLFAISSLLQSSYHIYHDIYGDHRALILCFDNRNTTAQYLYGLFAIVLCNCIKEQSPRKRHVLYLYLAALAYMIILTNSRTILIVSLVITGLSVVKTSKKTRLIITVAAFATPALFVMLYLSRGDLFNDTVVFGRSLMGGRYDIFVNLFANLKGVKLVFGDYGTYRFGNAHSLYLAILATVGIVGLALFIIWLAQIVKQLYSIQPNEKTRTPAYYAFLGILLSSASETGWFVSGGSLAFMLSLLYLMTLATVNDTKVYC